MMPVFSLVLDVDVSAEIAMTYPELYKELTKVGSQPDSYQLELWSFVPPATKCGRAKTARE